MSLGVAIPLLAVQPHDLVPAQDVTAASDAKPARHWVSDLRAFDGLLGKDGYWLHASPCTAILTVKGGALELYSAYPIRVAAVPAAPWRRYETLCNALHSRLAGAQVHTGPAAATAN